MELAVIGVDLAVARTDRSMPSRASANADAHGDDLVAVRDGNLALPSRAAILLQAGIAAACGKSVRRYRIPRVIRDIS